ncbi:MAG: lipoyl(octanoyl) transferase LipB [Armatimonadetes bacterium]|nr:lipoyl(octanoyl) transferase LipB [Armatimonadota bacterium]
MFFEILGNVPYTDALALQERMVDERAAGARGDTLLLLEHPPVITLGRGGRLHHLRASEEVLAARGVTLSESPRGGDITFHGPGQLVGYPIVALPRERRDVRRYVYDLEEVVIRTLSDFGLFGERVEGLRGIFVGRDKVAALGVRISRWITSHGFALNVSTDLSYFDLIVPCGIADRGVTSLERLLGRAVSMEEVRARVIERFAELFGSI